MMLMFELSKEHVTLPADEVLATLNAEHMKVTLLQLTEDVIIVDAPATDLDIRRLAERLAYSYIIDTFLFSCPASLDEIVKNARQHPLQQRGSIAIRCKNRSSDISSQKIIDVLGSIYTKQRTVNLTNPEIELRAVVTDDTVYIGVKKAYIDTSHFQRRRGHLRPFLLPITLHPKIARALVNLTQVNQQQTILDPFCGTGGILLEAGLLGMRIIGNDIEKKMIEGSRRNLEFYHLKNYQLFCSDIGDIQQYVTSVDAIATDFPYARGTTTKGEPLVKLCDRAFRTISEVLKKNRYAVVGLSNKDICAIGEQYLSVVDIYQMKSHRSLTRYFVVFKNNVR